jgi:HEAT repeat protein
MEENNDVDGLIRLLQDDIYANSAAEALGNLRDEKAIEPLEYLIEAPAMSYDDTINYSAISDALEALGKIGGEYASGTCTRALNKYWSVHEQGQATIAMGALDGLGEIGNHKDINKIIPYLNDNRYSGFVKHSALRALEKISARNSTHPLIDMLKHDDFDGGNCLYICLCLSTLRNPLAVEPLINLLNNHDNEIAQRAADSLGNFGDKKAVEPLIRSMRIIKLSYGEILLGDSSLRELADYRHKDLILEMLKKGPEKAELAANILVDWDDDIFCTDLDNAGFHIEAAFLKRDLTFLMDSLLNGESKMREKAILYICNSPNSPDEWFLGENQRKIRAGLIDTEVIKDNISNVVDILFRHEGKDFADEMINLIGTGESWADDTIIEKLVEIKDERAFNLVKSAFESDDSWRRKDAIIQLAKLGGSECTNILRTLSHAYNVHVLWSQRDITGLLDKLNEGPGGNPPKRWEQEIVFTALSHLKDPETVETIISFFNNPNGKIRSSAWRCLLDFDTEVIKDYISNILDHGGEESTITALTFLIESKKIGEYTDDIVPSLIRILKRGGPIEKLQSSAILSKMKGLDTHMGTIIEMKIKGNKVAEDLLECFPPINVGIALENLELYDDANAWYKSHGLLNEAANIRRKKANMHAPKTEIHGDYVDDRDTIVKDSVVNRSNIGSGGFSKIQELKELKEMFDSGFISKEDMEKIKKEILEK